MLEICANSIVSALAAHAGGADRIELCDNMQEGGTTPSIGMYTLVMQHMPIPVFPIIRPRGGDFLYTKEEYEVMAADISAFKNAGCKGVVLGILLEDGSIDQERCRSLIALARPMQVTFHRAFDRTADLHKALEDVITLGCDRLLTSGGEPGAFLGIHVIKKLVTLAVGRIIVMAGAGVDENNIAEIAATTKATEFHSTAKNITPSAMRFHNSSQLALNDASEILYQTDEQRVRLMKQALKNLSATHA